MAQEDRNLEAFNRLKCQLKSPSLTHDELLAADDELDRLWSKVINHPGMAAELISCGMTIPENYLASQPESKPTTTPILPLLKGALPLETWLNIASHARSPRILHIIEQNDQLRLDPESSQPEIPGALFVDHATRRDTLRTHKIAFGPVPGSGTTRSSRFLPRPVLFNTNTDIVFLSEPRTLLHFRRMSSNVARKDKVRFVAISAKMVCSEVSYITSILEMIRRFGTLEKLFIVGDRCPKEIEVLASALERMMAKCESHWRHYEANGFVFAAKWRKPVLCNRGWKEDLLQHVN